MTPFDSKSFSTSFEIVAWTDLDDELNFINDTTSYEFNTVTPDVLPLVEDFESTTGYFLMAGSARVLVTNLHNNVSYVSADNVYGVFNPSFQLTTTNIGPINFGDSLTFDYQIF